MQNIRILINKKGPSVVARRQLWWTGFTLVELLVTISILATLMAVLLPNLMGSRQRARDSKRIQELESMKNALRLYYNDEENYPEGEGVTDLSTELAGYLPGVAGIGSTYYYYQALGGDGFYLCADLEQGSGDSDVESQMGCAANMVICGLSVGVTADGVFVVCAN